MSQFFRREFCFAGAPIAVALLCALMGAAQARAAGPPKKNYDAFAQCLAGKKANMYGAFWCLHCKDQRDLFGKSWKFVPYVECSVKGQPPSVQTPTCMLFQIGKYPTWIFANGTRYVGVLKPEELSARTGCPLP